MELPMDTRQLDIPLPGEFGTKPLRQIRHQVKVSEPALINRLIDLRRAKGWMEEAGQLGPLVIEEKFHDEPESVCRFYLFHEAVDLGDDARIRPMLVPGVP